MSESDTYELRMWAEEAVNHGFGDATRAISAAQYFAMVIMSQSNQRKYVDEVFARLRFLPDRVDELEHQVKELTVWRPMNTAPKDNRRILICDRFHDVDTVLRVGTSDLWEFVPGADFNYPAGELTGWLPLPEARS